MCMVWGFRMEPLLLQQFNFKLEYVKGSILNVKNIAVIGTGYVGLVTGVCLSEIGHNVICIDVDEEKVKKLNSGRSPIFEPDLEDLMINNIKTGRLRFTTDYTAGFHSSEVIYIAVGTPQKQDGSADLQYIDQVAKQIAARAYRDIIVVTKSTVPVGTNDRIKKIIQENKKENVRIDIVSNPEFLREGSAVHDTFFGDRVVIGADCNQAAVIIEEINKPFKIPIFRTDIRSAEMIKYASNAFLATKISFINEIANICEKVGANVEEVAMGMGKDSRIGYQFLRAGIGYGGSCFPKDNIALVNIASNVNYTFQLLQSVIDINSKQQTILVEKAKKRFGSLKGKKFALLGLAFKPETDDMREAASIAISHRLIGEGAKVIAYDPIAYQNAKKVLPESVHFVSSIEEAIQAADAVFIVTEWKEISNFPLYRYPELMQRPIIFDGRNIYSIKEIINYPIEYHSIGRHCVNVKTS
jgi:UDPglucose 6-dehydrogenase